MKDAMELNENQALLTFEQVERLLYVMNEEIDVHGRGNFPTLRLSLNTLIKRIRSGLRARGLHVGEVKMNGGAASYILASRDLPYTDIDLIFGGIDLSGDGSSANSSTERFDLIRDAVLEALIHFLPECANKSKIQPASMREAYVKKMVKVSDRDVWSLLSLNNDQGRFIELKFVDRMRRQFQFSVDSFQIDLDSLVAFDDHILRYRQRSSISISTNHQDNDNDQDQDNNDQDRIIRISPSFFPSVVAESVYGNFRLALSHLNDQLIDTKEPELIRGGGLLKYCQLLSRGYVPVDPVQCRTWERYMCSRFFIDFPHIGEQERKLRMYMDNHFRADFRGKYEYLLLLYRVVDESTVCLMNHERRLTLSMIDRLIYDCTVESYYNNDQQQQNPNQQNQQIFAPIITYHHYPPQAFDITNPPPPFPFYHQQQQQQVMMINNNNTEITSPKSSISSPISTPKSSISPQPIIITRRASESAIIDQSSINKTAPERLLSTPNTSGVVSGRNSESATTESSEILSSSSEEDEEEGRKSAIVCCEQCQNHQPKQHLMYIPSNGSYWITVA